MFGSPVPPLPPAFSDLAVERLDQLADLFIAVRDKDRPTEFEAGLRGRKRRKLAAAAAAEDEGLEGLDEFRQRYNSAQRYVCLLFSVRSGIV